MRAASVPFMAADLQAQEAKVFNNQKRSCAFPFYVESQLNFPPNVGDVRLKAALQEKDPDSLSTFEPGPCFVACVNEGRCGFPSEPRDALPQTCVYRKLTLIIPGPRFPPRFGLCLLGRLFSPLRNRNLKPYRPARHHALHRNRTSVQRQRAVSRHAYHNRLQTDNPGGNSCSCPPAFFHPLPTDSENRKA